MAAGTTTAAELRELYTIMRERELGLSAAPDENDEGAA